MFGCRSVAQLPLRCERVRAGPRQKEIAWRLVESFFSATRRFKPTWRALRSRPSRRDRSLRESPYPLPSLIRVGWAAIGIDGRARSRADAENLFHRAQRGYAMLQLAARSGRSHTFRGDAPCPARAVLPVQNRSLSSSRVDMGNLPKSFAAAADSFRIGCSAGRADGQRRCRFARRREDCGGLVPASSMIEDQSTLALRFGPGRDVPCIRTIPPPAGRLRPHLPLVQGRASPLADWCRAPSPPGRRSGETRVEQVSRRIVSAPRRKTLRVPCGVLLASHAEA